MALRRGGVRPDSRDENAAGDRWSLENRVVRSALLVAAYIGAFFPLSAIPGTAAQFFAIIPIVVAAAWLGMRGGLIVGLGFVPLLVVLTVVAQGEPWDYMLYYGRPAALISLVFMAVVAGRAADLGRRLSVEKDVSESYVHRIEGLTTNLARLVTFGIDLADAYTVEEVYRISCTSIRSWLAPDRIAFAETDPDMSAVVIRYFEGMDIPGFSVGDRFEVDAAWRDDIESDWTSNRTPARTLPPGRLEKWRDAGFNSVLRIPLKTREEIAGYLAISSMDPDAFSESDEALMQSAAHHIQAHLRAASYFESNRREANFRRAQAEVARAFSMNTGQDVLCGVAFEQIYKLVGFDFGMVASSTQGGSGLTVVGTHGRYQHLMEPGGTFDWDPDLAHLDDEVRYWDLESVPVGEGAYPFSLFAEEGFKSVMMLTLMSEGEPVGWMILACIDNKQREPNTIQLIQGIGSHIANAIMKNRVSDAEKRLMSQLESQNNELRAAREGLQASREEVEKQNRELQKANEAKNTFLSAVSHELKTPLAIMVGFAELLGMNVPGNLTDQQLDQLKMVERNGRHLDLLVSDLVDVSRIEAGRLAVNLAPTDPQEVLEETLAGLDTIAADKSQTVTREFDLGGTWVRADRARLGQIVTNLVTNACKYSPEESEVTVSAQIDGHELEIVVTDRGLGISEEDQKKLFTPFFRSSNEEAQKEKGTGLGLVITRSIVEMHGGTLTLESELGRGTAITVRMPGVMEKDEESEVENADLSTDTSEGDAA